VSWKDLELYAKRQSAMNNSLKNLHKELPKVMAELEDRNIVEPDGNDHWVPTDYGKKLLNESKDGGNHR